MDVSGPIFVVLAIACLFYLVPRQLNWRIPTQADIDEQAVLQLPAKTVHAGVPVGQEEQAIAVSTKLMRSAGRRMAGRLARKAAKRRQLVLIVLITTAVATLPFAALSWIRWWVPLAAFGLVIAWLVFSHFESRRTTRQLNAIVAEIELGDDEKTMMVQLHPSVEPCLDNTAIVGPNGDTQLSLWQPITVVPATYISAPTAARTVRTIDLNAPVPKLPLTDWREDDQAIAV